MQRRALVLVGVAALALVIGGGAIARRRGGSGVLHEEATSPAADRLRALGCDLVTVINADDLAPLGGGARGAERVMVSCTGRGANVPACDDAALAYARAADDVAGGFVLDVRKTDGRGDHCMGRYGADGIRAR